MADNGAVVIQGCAYRITRLNADGSCSTGDMAMVQDDLPLIKVALKPNLVQGVDITPISACGVPIISYKDCDRYKRWDVEVDLGDWDPEAMEIIANGSIITGESSAGRTFDDGVFTLNENTLTSAADASFVPDDVGRSVTDAGFTVATCTLVDDSPDVTTAASFGTAGVTAGMPISGTGIPAGTTVLSVTDDTHLVMSANATSAEASETLDFSVLPYGTYVAEYISATEVRMNANALATTAAEDVTLGATGGGTLGYAFPKLLEVACANGFSLEVWSKQIVRLTGYQGTTPYPSAGTPTIPGSGYIRTGVFRIQGVTHMEVDVENKEMPYNFSGWALENPNFGTGPLDDWRISGQPGVGAAIDTTRVIEQIPDFALPGPLQPGYQTVA
jgi:hypothetical protein